jgi:hypothetical protein
VSGFPAHLRAAWACHCTAIRLLGLVIAGVVAGGFWYAAAEKIPVTSGLCYAIGVITTSGSSVPAGTSGQARLVTVALQLLLIPLAGAVFSLATSGLTSARVAVHLEGHHRRLHDKLDKVLKRLEQQHPSS